MFYFGNLFTIILSLSSTMLFSIFFCFFLSYFLSILLFSQYIALFMICCFDLLLFSFVVSFVLLLFCSSEFQYCPPFLFLWLLFFYKFLIAPLLFRSLYSCIARFTLRFLFSCKSTELKSKEIKIKN